MLSNEEQEKILNFLSENHCKWTWIDLITAAGPTKIEKFFKDLIPGDTLSHWSPTVPEGYLEIVDKKIVIHWIVGEESKLVNITCVDDVDFDEIDKSLASTIIHNSVIRILSENF